MIIHLNREELTQAAYAGCRRRIDGIANSRTDRWDMNERQGWLHDVIGAIGEAGVAKALGLPWHPDAGVGAPDVGGPDTYQVEVRATTHPKGRLMLHQSDHDHKRYYLARVYRNEVNVVGWILGRDGKNPEHWQDPGTGRPAYFVPVEALEAV